MTAPTPPLRFRVEPIRETTTPEHADIRISAFRSSVGWHRIGTLCCTPDEAQALIDLFGEMQS